MNRSLISEKKPFVSIVTACYNESLNIPKLFERLSAVLKNVDYELIIVDDGSTDNSTAVLEILEKESPKVKAILKQTNSGQLKALKTGIESATGTLIVTMDGDLQHPPELIPALIEKWREGFPVVNTITNYPKSTPRGKRMASKLFYTLINVVSQSKIEPGLSDFRLFESSLKEELNQIDPEAKFLRGAFSRLSCRKYYLEYTPNPRLYGTSKWNNLQLLKIAIDAFRNSLKK